MPNITIETQEEFYREIMEQFGKIGVELPNGSAEAERFWQLQTKFMHFADNYRLLLSKPKSNTGVI